MEPLPSTRWPPRRRTRGWLPAVGLVMASMLGEASHALGATDAASSPDGSPAVEAKRHYEEGTKAFNLAEFPRAIAEFKAAYNAKPDPLLLYNIAQSFRLAGDEAQALLFYKSFLRNMPDAPNRREIEGRIRTLEKHLAEHKKDTPLSGPPLAAASGNGASASPGSSDRPAPSEPGAVEPAAPASSTPTTATPSGPVVTASPEGPHGGPSRDAADLRRVRAAEKEKASVPAAPPPSPSLFSAPTSPPSPFFAQPARVDVSNRGEPPAADSTPLEPTTTPIYKKWWFWAGAGAVVLTVAAVVANANKAPSTPLGLYVPTFR